MEGKLSSDFKNIKSFEIKIENQQKEKKLSHNINKNIFANSNLNLLLNRSKSLFKKNKFTKFPSENFYEKNKLKNKSNQENFKNKIKKQEISIFNSNVQSLKTIEKKFEYIDNRNLKNKIEARFKKISDLQNIQKLNKKISSENKFFDLLNCKKDNLLIKSIENNYEIKNNIKNFNSINEHKTDINVINSISIETNNEYLLNDSDKKTRHLDLSYKNLKFKKHQEIFTNDSKIYKKSINNQARNFPPSKQKYRGILKIKTKNLHKYNFSNNKKDYNTNTDLSKIKDEQKKLFSTNTSEKFLTKEIYSTKNAIIENMKSNISFYLILLI